MRVWGEEEQHTVETDKYLNTDLMISNCCLLTIVEIITRSPCLLTFIMSQISKDSKTQLKNKVHLEDRFINDL